MRARRGPRVEGLRGNGVAAQHAVEKAQRVVPLLGEADESKRAVALPAQQLARGGSMRAVEVKRRVAVVPKDHLRHAAAHAMGADAVEIFERRVRRRERRIGMEPVALAASEEAQEAPRLVGTGRKFLAHHVQKAPRARDRVSKHRNEAAVIARLHGRVPDKRENEVRAVRLRWII